MQVRAGMLASDAARRFGDAAAVTYDGVTTSFAELEQHANRAGSGLLQTGLKQGDVVGVLMYNRPELVHVWLGLERAGLVRTTLHTHFEMQTHVAMLRSLGSSTVVFDDRLSSAFEPFVRELADFRLIAIGDHPPAWATAWADIVSGVSDRTHFVDVDEDSAVFVQPTTGTTGPPKPWIVTHRSWAAAVNQNLHHLDTFRESIPALAGDDVWLHVHALQWASGFQLLYPAIIRGARTVLLDDVTFDPEAIVDVIVEQVVTGVLLPAPMLTPILDVIERRGGIVHALRRLVVFFATPELLTRTTELLGPVWCHGFGSTEQGAPTTRLLASDVVGHPDRLVSVGRPASPFFEVAVVNDSGERVEAGELGEIVVRSAMSNSTYADMPQRTEHAFLKGGWFRPEDVGYLDADGFLYFVDRAVDSIHTGHSTVYPHLVESAVLRHRAVANCGVVGDEAGNVIAAVVLKPGHVDSGDLRAEIMATASEGLKAHEVPRILVVPELPTVLGGAKVQRGVLRGDPGLGPMTETSDALRKAGDRVLLMDAEGRTRTGAELYESVSRLAGALESSGLAGRAVGHWYTNSIPAVEAALAIEWVGGTRVPVDPNSAAAEAQATWRFAAADGVLADAGHAGSLGVSSSTTIVHDIESPIEGRSIEPVESVPAGRTYLLYPRAALADQLFAIPLSYGNWNATMKRNVEFYRTGIYGGVFGDDECFLTVQQLMHGTGLVGSFPFLRMGLPQYVLGKFAAGQVLDLIESGAVTSTVMVTAMVERLTDQMSARPRPLGRLRRLLYGGARMTGQGVPGAARALPGVLVQIYGRLEGGWPLAVLDQDAHAAIACGDRRAESCGRPVPGVDLTIRPTGEIAVRSDMTVSEFADSDGWCGLGDTGVLEDDFLYLTGRLDRMINTGYHVYPAEIEDVIREVPEVDAVLVKGEPDELRSERIVAILVASRADPEQLTALVDNHVRARLASYKVPRRYTVVDALPAE